MENNFKFFKYKRIKSELIRFNFYGVNVGLISGSFVADLVYGHQKGLGRFGFIKLILKRLFIQPSVRKVNCNGGILSTTSSIYPRYKNISDAYISDLGWRVTWLPLFITGLNFDIKFNFNALIFSFFVALRSRLGVYEKFVAFVSVYAATCFLKKCVRVFDKNLPTIHLSFCSGFLWESVATVYLRFKGVSTYSTQFGVMVKYGNSIPFAVTDYENQTAEYILVWGEFFKEQVNGMLPESTKAIVYGHPIYRYYEYEKSNNISNEILVCLPRIDYYKESINLVNLISSSLLKDYSFLVRPHPSLDFERLENEILGSENISISLDGTLTNLLRSSKFKAVIGFNSTSVFDAVANFIPVIQYISGNDEFCDIGFYEFSGADELLSKLENLSVKPENRDYYFSLLKPSVPLSEEM